MVMLIKALRIMIGIALTGLIVFLPPLNPAFANINDNQADDEYLIGQMSDESHLNRQALPLADHNLTYPIQSPFFVIHEASIAGYNFVLNRDLTDTSDVLTDNELIENEASQRLIQTWGSPDTAARWIETVVGDRLILAKDPEDELVRPGVGLLPEAESLANGTQYLLEHMVLDNEEINEFNLVQISGPSVQVTPDIINALAQMDPDQQNFAVNQVSQTLAILRLLDQAVLAQQLLQLGSQVPAINNYPDADQEISRAIQVLDEEMANLRISLNRAQNGASPALLYILIDLEDQAANTIDDNRLL